MIEIENKEGYEKKKIFILHNADAEATVRDEVVVEAI